MREEILKEKIIKSINEINDYEVLKFINEYLKCIIEIKKNAK